MNFEIILGDITKIKVDAIANAANRSLLGGGGVDGAIHRAAGKELLAECKALGGCQTGDAKITNAYKLPAKYVLHTPGPVWHGGITHEAELLAGCYRNCLKLAERYNCRSVAFPSISTGIYGYPVESAADIAVAEIHRFLQNAVNVRKVYLVCFDEITKAAYDKAYGKLKEGK
jgi:O-acetyl-ADP-ribose deacetylase (regulator of RNase III)